MGRCRVSTTKPRGYRTYILFLQRIRSRKEVRQQRGMVAYTTELLKIWTAHQIVTPSIEIQKSPRRALAISTDGEAY